MFSKADKYSFILMYNFEHFKQNSKIFKNIYLKALCIARILEENMREHKKFTQAQDTPPLSH